MSRLVDFATSVVLWNALAVLEDNHQRRLLLMVRIVPEWLADVLVVQGDEAPKGVMKNTTLPWATKPRRVS